MLKIASKIELFEDKYDKFSCGWMIDGVLDYGSVELEVGRLIYALVLVHQPKIVLETGTFMGYSTSCIASALKQIGGKRIVHTIDCSPKDFLFKDSSLDEYINFIPGRSQDVSGIFDQQKFDMLVLDSNHDYETILSELKLYEPKLVDGGIILIHDSLFFDGVGAAVSQIISSGRFECVTLDTPRHHHPRTKRSPGISIIRKLTYGDPLSPDGKFSGWFKGDSQSEPFLRIEQKASFK